MRIKQLFDLLGDIKPHAYSTGVLLHWLNEAEGLVQSRVWLLAVGDMMQYTSEDVERDCELLAAYPHDKLYLPYLEAMVDYSNGEYARYANSLEKFNVYFDEYMNWFATRYRPADGGGCCGRDEGYYISAYGLAVKHGYSGSEEDWLRSLKGDRGVTFVPTVSGGVLSWSNDGGLDNPDPVSLAGIGEDEIDAICT